MDDLETDKTKKYRTAGHGIFWQPFWDAHTVQRKKKNAQNFFPSPRLELPETDTAFPTQTVSYGKLKLLTNTKED